MRRRRGDVGGERLVDVVELEGDRELAVAGAHVRDPRALRERREREVAAEEAGHRRGEPDDRHPLRRQPQEAARPPRGRRASRSSGCPRRPVVSSTPSSVSASRIGRRAVRVHRSTLSWLTYARRPTGPACSRGGRPGTTRTCCARTTTRSSTRPAASTAGTSTLTTSSSPRSRPCGDDLDPGADRVVDDPRRGVVDERQERRRGAAGRSRRLVGGGGRRRDQLGIVEQAPRGRRRAPRAARPRRPARRRRVS